MPDSSREPSACSTFVGEPLTWDSSAGTPRRYGLGNGSVAPQLVQERLHATSDTVKYFVADSMVHRL